jgi:hypothetical protein
MAAAAAAAAAPPVPAPAAPAAAARATQDATGQALLALAQSLMACPTDTPAPAMPAWNGTEASKPFFFEEMDVYKKHKYFSNVVDWTRADAAHQEHSLHLH